MSHPTRGYQPTGNLLATPTGYCTGKTANEVKDTLHEGYHSWKQGVTPALTKALSDHTYDFNTHFHPTNNKHKVLTDSYKERRHELPQRKLFGLFKRGPKTLDEYEKIHGADEHGVRLQLLGKMEDRYNTSHHKMLNQTTQKKLQSEYSNMKGHTENLRERLVRYGIEVPTVEGHGLPADLPPTNTSSGGTTHRRGQGSTSGPAASQGNRHVPVAEEEQREKANAAWAKRSHAGER